MKVVVDFIASHIRKTKCRKLGASAILSSILRKMCSKKLTLLSFLIHFLCHFGLAVWEDSIRHLSVRDADLHDPAFGIGSIQEYYRDVFDTKNWGVDDEQIHAESVTFERIVPGRYAVVFKADVPDGVIEKTVDLLTNAHQRTDGKLKATHFMHIKHAAKGFFATLSKQLVKVVSWKVLANESCDGASLQLMIRRLLGRLNFTVLRIS